MREIDKLDGIDQKVIIWCAQHMPLFVDDVLKMHHFDYKQKGVELDVVKILIELERMI
ncbi:MAG: hypothetical protein WAU36_04065 [Cyclobacteriaceae bacterium]